MYLESEHCTEVRFASLLSGGFTAMAVINTPENKLEKRTSVQWLGVGPHGEPALLNSAALRR